MERVFIHQGWPAMGLLILEVTETFLVPNKYYLRFTQMINDMNIYTMKMDQFQVNTKFLNSLPPEWGKFVTDVKLVKDLHTTNFDQLHAYLEQHKLYANEVYLMRERIQDPLALVVNHQMTPSHFNTYQSSYNNPHFQQQQQFSPSQSPQYRSNHPIQHYSTTYPSIPHAITYPSTPYPNAYSSTIHQEACPQPQSVPQIEYTISAVNQQTHLAKFPQIDFGLAVLVFKQGDDPIDAINKMMSFLSVVVTSRYPSTNNQLRNSSSPRQQVTIHDGRVIVQPLQGRQNSYVAGTSGTRANTFRTGGNYSGQQRAVKCFNCQWEGHMARQYPKPKRKRDATWFRDKVLLVEAQGNSKVLNEEELEFLANPGIAEAKVVLMANLSSYGSDFLSEVPISDNTNNDILNQIVQDINSSAQQDALILSVFEQLSNQVTNCNKVNNDNLIANESLSAELKRYKELVKLLEERQNVDLDFEKEINYLKQTISEQSQENELLTKTFNVFRNESKEKEAKNIDTEIALEKKVKELDNIVCKMGQSAQIVHMLTKPQVFYDNNLKQALGFQNPFYLKKSQQIRPMLYDGNVIAKETNVISIVDFEETLMLEEGSRSKMLLKQVLHPITDQSVSSPVKIEAPRELPKVSLVNTSLKKLKYHLGQFDNVVKKWITPDALTEGEWGFEQTKAVFQKEIIPFLKALKVIFNVFDKDLLNEKQFLIENDRLLDQIISQDIVNIVVNSSVDVNTCMKVNSSVVMNDSVNYVEICNKCLELEAELIKQHNMVEKDEYTKFSKRFSELEQHCISLEIAMQLNKEIFQKNSTSVNQNEPSFNQLFKLNNLKAKLQAKDTTIEKLKANIKRLNKTSTTNNVKKDIDEIETINIKLELRVTKLIAEIEHLKQTYKQLYDSIKPSRIRAKE
ncbi:retrovirus-related pol polyprotein from transposon TNT 1-94 [Tanacetum coccineum]